MVVISDFEEDHQQKQEKPSSSSSQSDVETLASIMAKMGPMKFLKTVVDLISTRSDLFKDEASAEKAMAVVSAVKEKEDAERRKKKAEEERKILEEEIRRKKKAEEERKILEEEIRKKKEVEKKKKKSEGDEMLVDKEDEEVKKEDEGEANGESKGRTPNLLDEDLELAKQASLRFLEKESLRRSRIEVQMEEEVRREIIDSAKAAGSSSGASPPVDEPIIRQDEEPVDIGEAMDIAVRSSVSSPIVIGTEPVVTSALSIAPIVSQMLSELAPTLAALPLHEVVAPSQAMAMVRGPLNYVQQANALVDSSYVECAIRGPDFPFIAQPRTVIDMVLNVARQNVKVMLTMRPRPSFEIFVKNVNAYTDMLAMNGVNTIGWLNYVRSVGKELLYLEVVNQIRVEVGAGNNQTSLNQTQQRVRDEKAEVERLEHIVIKDKQIHLTKEELENFARRNVENIRKQLLQAELNYSLMAADRIEAYERLQISEQALAVQRERFAVVLSEEDQLLAMVQEHESALNSLDETEQSSINVLNNLSQAYF